MPGLLGSLFACVLGCNAFLHGQDIATGQLASRKCSNFFVLGRLTSVAWEVENRVDGGVASIVGGGVAAVAELARGGVLLELLA